MPLPRCFFDIAINGIPTGRIVFELFVNQCPNTCENFRCLCTGEKGEGKTTFKPLHYKGTPIHRIVKGFIVQGGDFVNGDGTGGESIYGGLFDDENLKLKHDKKLLLSMANKGPNTNGSQFFITTRASPHLDGIHVVFGQVVDGQQFVLEIENQKVDASHRPYADVRISNCGELVLMRRGKVVGSKKAAVSSSESESSSNSEGSSDEESSSSEEEVRRKARKKRRSKRKVEKKRKKKTSRKSRQHKKHRRKKHKKQQSSESSDSEEDADGNRPDEPVTSTVREEDLPPDISSTAQSWLYRASKSPSPRNGEEERTTRRRDPVFTCIDRRNEVSHSGRKLKGRGIMRYHTPPRGGAFESTEWFPHRDTPRHLRDAPQSRYRSRSRSRSRSRERRRRFSSRERRLPHSERYGRWRRSRSRDRQQHRSRSSRSPSYNSRSLELNRSLSPSTRQSHLMQSRSPDRSSRSRRGRDRSHNRESYSPSPDRFRSRDVRKRKMSGSKFSRHRDSRSEDSDSGSDKELERTYQRAERSLAEQQFGIDNLLPQ